MREVKAGQLVRFCNLNSYYASMNGIITTVAGFDAGNPVLMFKGTRVPVCARDVYEFVPPKIGDAVRLTRYVNPTDYGADYPMPPHPSPTTNYFGQEAQYVNHASDLRFGAIRFPDGCSFNVRNEWLEVISQKQKESNVATTDMFTKLKNSLFRSINEVALDLQTLKAGIKLPSGVVTLEITAPDEVADEHDVEPQYELAINQMSEFSISLPAWATRVPVDALTLGDIIVLDSDKLAFFIKKGANGNAKNPTVVALEAESRNEVTSNLATNRLFGGGGVLAVRNAFGPTIGDVGGLLPMMVAAENEGDMGRMLAIMSMMGAMGGGKNKDQGMAQMLPFLLLNDKSLGADPEKLMLLSAMGGGVGGNPLMALMMSKMFTKEAAAK